MAQPMCLVKVYYSNATVLASRWVAAFKGQKPLVVEDNAVPKITGLWFITRAFRLWLY